DFDGHDLLHVLLMKAVNKGFFMYRRPPPPVKTQQGLTAQQQAIWMMDSTVRHGGCFRCRQTVDEHQ
ncbi:MAG: hypothetical protein ACPHJD_01815, partial [Poseidonia sp.]